MIRLQRFLLAAVLGVLGVTACRAPQLVGPASLGLDAQGGSLELGFVVPRESYERDRKHRRVQYVSTGKTTQVKITLKTSPGGAVQPTQTFPVTLTDDAVTGDKVATVTMAGLPAGNNHTVVVDVYDGTTLLETLKGVVDIVPSGTTSAQISWRTTPTADAINVLRDRGEPQRLLAKSLNEVYAVTDIVETYKDGSGNWVAASPTYAVNDPAPPASQPVVLAGEPKPGANVQLVMDQIIDNLIATRDMPKFHPSLVYGDPLGHLIMNHTLAQPGYASFTAGYAVPKPSHAGANTDLEKYAYKVHSRALDVKVFDMRGQMATSGVNVWIEEPSSPLVATAPFDFPFITPGIWWVTGKQTSGVNTRESSFQRQFRAGYGLGDPLKPNELPNICLPGTTSHFIDAGLVDPRQICFDRLDNLYVADRGAHQIKMIAPNGTITVVAGLGTPTAVATDPYSLGDYVASGTDVLNEGNPASATFNFPEGVAVEEWEASGSWYKRIYIADTQNHRIRMIDTDNRIKTIIGTGVPGGGLDLRLNTTPTTFTPDGKGDEKDPANTYPGVNPGESDGGGVNFFLRRPTNIVIGGSSLRTLYIHDSGNLAMRYTSLQDVSSTSTPKEATVYDSMLVSTLPNAKNLLEPHNGLAIQSFQDAGGAWKDYLYYCAGSSSVQVRRHLIGSSSTTEPPIIMGATSAGVTLPQLQFKTATQITLKRVRAIAVDRHGNVYVSDEFPADPANPTGPSDPSKGHVYYLHFHANTTQFPPNGSLFTDVWGLLGRSDVAGVYTGAYEGITGPLSPIAYPYGLATLKTDPAFNTPLYIATGDADPRVLKLNPW